jgi:spermidine synthase
MKLRFYWVVAACGAIIMALEILASRVLAPVFGNSVYVWGSIISVFLAALAVGYRLGGRLADREPSLAALGRLVLLAALSQAVLLLAGRQLVAALGRATGASPGGTLVATTLLFGPASLLLATVSPYAVRLAARDLGHLGDTAGRLFALSTAGSLVGTLGCTFGLIPFLELIPILALLLGATAATAVVAIGVGGRRELWSHALAATLVVFAVVKGARPPPLPPGALYSVTTPYQTLEVGELYERRYLTSNGMLHGAIVHGSGEPGLVYQRHVALGLLFQPRLERVLVLGMGAGGAGSYLQRRLPGLVVDYVDIDPEVPRIARRFFGFHDAPNARVHVGDARVFLTASGERWDMIYSDVYIGLSVPFHLTTQELMEQVRGHLATGGVFAMNLAGGLDDPFSRSIHATVQRTLGAARVFRLRGASGVLLVAGPGASGYLPDLQARAHELDRRFSFSPTLTQMLALERGGPEISDGIVLRDAFAPVEHLVPVGTMRELDAERWRELSGRVKAASPPGGH